MWIDYFFSNYYVDLSERENAVYIIDSFLELVDSYIKYKDLMISMTNSNKVLTEKDKMNLKFLFKVSVPEGIEVPKTLEELSEFKLKLYSDYIDKINNNILIISISIKQILFITLLLVSSLHF